MSDKTNPSHRKNPLEQDNDPGEYVIKTVRSAALCAILIALGLAAKHRYDLVAPLFTGTALGCALLAAWERFASALFTPQAVREKKFSRKWSLTVFALIKYPLVAFLIYWITRHWNQTQLLWFVVGFILLQVVILLRAIGRALTEDAPGR